VDFKVRKVTAAMPNRLECVYLETTFISYLVAEDSRDTLIARRQAISRGWFERQRHKYDCVVSAAVEDECRRGDPEQAARRMAILAGLSTLAVNSEIMELASLLLIPGGLPAGARLDAIHLAAATVHKCDFLLTWNIRHIANASIRKVTERILKSHGYEPALVCTPEELF
jgi:hypothetical protein